MREFLRRRTRLQLGFAAGLLCLLMAIGAAAAVGRQRQPVRQPLPAARSVHPEAASTTMPEPTGAPSAGPTTTPSPPLLRTSSADVYAREVATALWDVNYAATSHEERIGFWRRELATTLPAGTPPGATLAQAHAAAMSTLDSYLPSAAMWATLAAEHTVSAFTVTGVSEPASWVAAVTSGKIADPGLTARTVVGVQTISYGTATARRATHQSQQVTVAMLCPPTTGSCRVEILPPTGSAGTGG